MAFIYDLADTWNDAGTTFTAIKMDVTDTASDAASLLMDLQVGSSSRVAINKNGSLTVNTPDIADGDILFAFKENGTSKFVGTARNGFSFSYGSSRAVNFQRDGSTQIQIGDLGSIPRITLGAGTIEWNPNIVISGANDLILARDAADTLAQRRTTNAQTFNLYNTYTDASNYERASFTQTATGLVLDSQYLGTGTEPDNILELKSGGSSKFSVDKLGRVLRGGNLIFGLSSNRNIIHDNNGDPRLAVTPDYIGFKKPLAFGILDNGSNADVFFTRDAANTLAQRNDTNAQESRLYGTYTSATDYQRLSTKTIKEAVTAASGASVTTTISIPKYSQLIGVTTRVTTDLGNSNGTTGYTVGDGSDADLWGDITGITAGTTSDAADFTAAGALGPATADRTITLTATGGNFDGTGVIQVCAFYLRAEAD